MKLILMCEDRVELESERGKCNWEKYFAYVITI